MTCDHCRRAVTQELEALALVDRVDDVDLATGVVTVTTTDRLLTDEEIARAVEEAGYEAALGNGSEP